MLELHENSLSLPGFPFLSCIPVKFRESPKPYFYGDTLASIYLHALNRYYLFLKEFPLENGVKNEK